MTKSDDIKDAREAFAACVEAEQENRADALDDLKFGRLGDQWPEEIKKNRSVEGRPCLTINTMPTFLRQVTNDARQNKPSIRVKPADSFADIHTAEVMNGLIRNIEQISNAGVAYDTAIDNAASMGWGYFRVTVDYAFDDTFDKELLIQAVPNTFSIYGDPQSTKADSSDWNVAFVTEMIDKEAFRKQYKGAEEIDWETSDYAHLDSLWREKDEILLAEYWTREQVQRKILRLSNGIILSREEYEENIDQFEPGGIAPVAERDALGYKVTHRLMTGAEVLTTTEWAGKYIPIIPVYGEEVNVQGKRHWRSLIRDAKDAKRMENYWRSAETELVALAPLAPWIGPEEAFTGKDAARWDVANRETFSTLSYKGTVSPQRIPFSGVPAGALQEALNSREDQKAIMGLYDASLGARSNETSGKAIMARQREGDVATFHFQDNLNRGIAHLGRVLIDLIPKVYTGQRMVRILGSDGDVQNVQLQSGQELGLGQMRGPPPERGMLPNGKPDLSGVFDLSMGRYDLVVDAGPSYTTRRQEAAEQMMELVRVYPDAAPMIGDLLVKNLDWPGAQEISERLKAMLPPALQGEQELSPQHQAEMQAMTEQMQQLAAALQEAQQQLAQAQVEGRKIDLENKKLELENKKTDIERTEVNAEATKVTAEAHGAMLTNETLTAMAQAAAMMQAAAAALMQRTTQPRRITKLADGVWQADTAPEPIAPTRMQ